MGLGLGADAAAYCFELLCTVGDGPGILVVDPCGRRQQHGCGSVVADAGAGVIVLVGVGVGVDVGEDVGVKVLVPNMYLPMSESIEPQTASRVQQSCTASHTLVCCLADEEMEEAEELVATGAEARALDDEIKTIIREREQAEDNATIDLSKELLRLRNAARNRRLSVNTIEQASTPGLA